MYCTVQPDISLLFQLCPTLVSCCANWKRPSCLEIILNLEHEVLLLTTRLGIVTEIPSTSCGATHPDRQTSRQMYYTVVLPIIDFEGIGCIL